MTRHPARSRRAALGLVAVVTLTACGGDAPTPPTALPSRSPSPSAGAREPSSVPSASSAAPSGQLELARLSVTFEPVVERLDRPLAVVHAGDGSGRLFIAQQGGRIDVVRDGRVSREPFLDIADRISAGGERGLLGLAFHPAFPDDPRLFVNYTEASEGDTIVASFRVTGDDRADPDSEEVLLRIDQPFANHNGGALSFGPDGYLYIATGDGGSGGDPQDNGQRLDTLLGKILRIDVDRDGDGRPYGIPADNPFARGGGEPEIWLYGLRNPWRMSVDRDTGDLWIGDVGQGAWEEIDVHRTGSPGGTNFGWARMEGFHCRGECDEAAFAPPVTEYGHDAGCTVIGGHVYRGTSQPSLLGAYLFADYCSGQVWAIDARRDERQEPVPIASLTGQPSSFGEDEAGELYLTTLSGGELLRVTADDR
jgi:glucose/arabinose dehydrogenase